MPGNMEVRPTEIEVAKLSRSQIDLICDAVLPVVSVDAYTSAVQTSILRERIRDQLVEVELYQSEEAFEMLTAYMVNRMRMASIIDEKNIGLIVAEALSAGVAQASMNAFKATTQDVPLTVTVNQLSSCLSTVNDRSDQKVTMHCDPAWALNGHNWTLREYADLRSVFVHITLEDVAPPGKVIIGVLKDYEGDGLTDAMRRAKTSFREDSLCPWLEPGRWNKVRALKPDGYGVVCMRLYLDSQLAYSHGISMNKILQELINLSGELNCSVTGSSLQTGIVDILSRDTGRGSNLLSILSIMERIRLSFGNVDLSGLRSVKSMALERVDLPGLITSSKPANEYRVSQLGIQRLLDANSRLDLTWRDLEDESYVITTAELNSLPETALIIGSLDDDTHVIYSPQYSTSPGQHGGIRAHPDDLTSLYVRYYLQSLPTQVASLADLWVLRLDVVMLKRNCIDLSMIAYMLDFCGVFAVAWERAHTSDLIEYIYVDSPTDPLTIIRAHFDPASYYNEETGSTYAENENLSLTAKQAIAAHLQEKPSTLIVSELQNIESQYLDSISKYYYAVLSVAKKDSSSKEGGPIVEHVAPHIYTEILRYPFVSREKTTCNDWHTMTYVLGADAAKNNYILEIVQLFQQCDIKIDPRHLDLLSDYVFETGEPAGVGIAPMKRHGIGFTHEMSTQNTYSQLPGGHLRTAETVESYSIATYMGSPPIGPDTKRRQVEQAKRLEEMERSRFDMKRGRTKLVLPAAPGPARNTDAIDIAIRSMFLDTDPYYSIPTFEVADAILPRASYTLDDTGFVGSQLVMDRVRERAPLDSIIGNLERLREYVGHVKKILKMPITANIIDMDELEAYFTEHAAYFT